MYGQLDRLLHVERSPEVSSILKLKTHPVSEPVTLTEVKAHLRIDSTTEDTLLNSLIKAARQHIESFCGPLINQTWEQYEHDWPTGDVLRLGKPRLQSVTSIEYTDAAGATATLSSSNYDVSLADGYKPKVVLKETSEWPATELSNVDPILITFVAGYGDTSADIPEPLRLAVLFLVAHWYEHREPVEVLNTMHIVPFTVDALMSEYRLWS